MNPTEKPSRAARKQAANDRRNNWHQRWIAIARKKVAEEHISLRDALHFVSTDAEQLARKEPTLKSEIEYALTQFARVLASATLATLNAA